MKITNCKVDHLTNPIGFQMGKPSFSWIVAEAKGKTQTAARICVSCADGCVYDTGWSALSSLATPLPLSLLPRTRYFWRVFVQSDAGETCESDEQFFETGKRDEPWLAKWITYPSVGSENLVFSRRFSLRGEVRSARLYISGLGLFEARLNGEKIGNEFLMPYCTDYRSLVQAMTFDVGALLCKENELCVELADGWYKGRFGLDRTGTGEGNYGLTRKLIAELHLVYTDGTEQVVISDENWQVFESPIRFANLYDGEHRDDRRPILTLGSTRLLTEDAPPLGDRLSLPVTVREELCPIELIHTPAGETVLDMGQNFAGIFRLHVCEPAGCTVRLSFGEVLQGGNFYRDNLRSAKAEYVYISDGREHVLEPKFTYYGYRYVKVEGITDLHPADYTGLALCSSVQDVGTLKTGHEKLNQLLSNIRWGQRSNFLDVPTDCPQRDERLGWTADTQVFVPTACYLSDCLAFYRKYLRDLRSEQRHLNGAVPFVVPSFGLTDSCSVWGDAAVIIPWELYLRYGDPAVLRESLESMCAWVDYIRRVDGEDHGWRRVFHFGDWLALDYPVMRSDTVKGGTEEAFIADVYYMMSAELCAKAAELLGEEATQERYAALAAELRSQIMEEYYSRTGRCVVGTQTGLTLTLLHDLSVSPDRTLQELKKQLQLRDNKLVTGFVGTPLICRALSRAGEDSLAYEILLDEEYPGWLYEVNLGATTIWERWNSMEPDGSVSSTGMNSFNHYAYGAIGQWIWETIAGILPCDTQPGFRRVLLRPVPNWALRCAEADYTSPAGTWRVAWQITDSVHVQLHLDVPFGCTARLVLPWAKGEQEWELCSGTHSFLLETKVPLREEIRTDLSIAALMARPKAKKLLIKTLPQLSRLPERMWNMSLRQVLTRGGMTEQLKELENALSKL